MAPLLRAALLLALLGPDPGGALGGPQRNRRDYDDFSVRSPPRRVRGYVSRAKQPGRFSSPEPPAELDPASLRFRDVSVAAGISRVEQIKYGGPVVADLDGDGVYDLVLTYHNGHSIEVYFGEGNGTFVKADFERKRDIHGVAVAPLTASTVEKVIVLSLGGSQGRNPRPPTILKMTEGRDVAIATDQVVQGDILGGRGRITMFMDLSMENRKKRLQNGGGPDLLVANFRGFDAPVSETSRQFALRNENGTLLFKNVPGFAGEVQGRAELTDIDGDGHMEVVSYQEFRIYKLVAPFRFAEITSQVAPGLHVEDYSIMAVTEFDMDNDGDFDLYLARGFEKLASSQWFPGQRREFPDILLENRGGVYVDVSDGANIVGNTVSMGVSAEDFDNDGFVDLLVTQYDGPDVLLLNNGDGTFTHSDPRTPKTVGRFSDNSLAVDYDGDGRVDIITSEGLRKDFVGSYFIMKNVMRLAQHNRYLLVRVGNEPKGTSSALHAVVTVLVGRRKLVRRVGGRGSQKAGPASYIDTLHFGLGRSSRVKKVIVRWTSGIKRSRKKIAANQLIAIGSIQLE